MFTRSQGTVSDAQNIWTPSSTLTPQAAANITTSEADNVRTTLAYAVTTPGIAPPSPQTQHADQATITNWLPIPSKQMTLVPSTTPDCDTPYAGVSTPATTMSTGWIAATQAPPPYVTMASAHPTVIQDRSTDAWRPTPTFSGEALESPESFLRLVEQLHITDENYLTHYVLSNCIKGDAAKWIKRLAIDEATPWSTFCYMLTATYNAEPVIRNLEARLHGEVQQPNEPALAFLIKKNRIVRRLGVPVTQALIRRLVYQLRHDLRPHLLISRINSIDELQQAAFDLELQLAPLEARSSKAGPQRQEHQEQSSRRQTPQEQTNPFSSAAAPPSACRFCSGAHWNRDCPHRPVQGNC